MTVMLGAGLAHGFKPDLFSWLIAIMCWLFAWCMHIAANLINDVVDYNRGLDKSDPERIDRIYANGLITKKMAYTTIGTALFLGCLIGLTILYLVWDHLLWGGWEIVLMGAIVVACTFLYSTTFAYHGLGDLAVLLCFGLIPVCGTFYVLTYTVTWDAVWASIVAGCSIDTLLIVNNYRDIDNDRKAGKKTLAVLIGKKPMLALYIILPLIAVCVTVFVCGRNDVWTYCYIGFMSSFFGASFANILRIGEGRALNKVLGDTARNIFIYGLLTSLYIIL